MLFLRGGIGSQLSGTSMQTNVSKGRYKRRRRREDTLPGFPAEPFQTLEDIEAYVGRETITCLVCGHEYQALLCHVGKTHDMDEAEYRRRFNIPAKYHLTGAILREKRRAVCARPEFRAMIAKQQPKKARTAPIHPLLREPRKKLISQNRWGRSPSD